MLRPLHFIKFEAWKEKEEEATYTAYVKGQKSYIPKSTNNGTTEHTCAMHSIPGYLLLQALLCLLSLHMHVHMYIIQGMENHLRGVKQENQIELYQILCILESETNKERFQILIKQFTEHWSPVEPEFIAYFSEHYANRAGLFIS